jgi:hypothetical protein
MLAQKDEMILSMRAEIDGLRLALEVLLLLLLLLLPPPSPPPPPPNAAHIRLKRPP